MPVSRSAGAEELLASRRATCLTKSQPPLRKTGPKLTNGTKKVAASIADLTAPNGNTGKPHQPDLSNQNSRFLDAADSAMNKLIPAAVLARQHGLAPSTVTRRCMAGLIPGAQRVGRIWAIPADTVLAQAGTGGWPKGKPRKVSK